MFTRTASSETSSLLPAASIVAENNQATEESVEVVRTPSQEDNTSREEGPIAQLARRLRCLFSTLTWPIIPLGTILTFTLLWVLYAAFVLDVQKNCSRPLHWYAIISLLFITYAPYHPKVRNYLFDYSPEQDGPPRPIAVRLYDQLFHTMCILYVYSGVTLLETCRESTGKNTGEDVFDKDNNESMEEGVTNTCAATCPNLYQALSIYVTTLELFAFSLILPLLFLPCVYLWILRRASAEAEAFSQFQDRLEEEEALLHNGGVTAQEIIDSLEQVKLVETDDDDNGIAIVPLSATTTSSSNSDKRTARECCICMSEFEVTRNDDVEAGISPSDPENAMVRTKCGHIFHGSCLACWLGGRWEPNSNETRGGSSDRPRRRARRTACPLCREDLKPSRES